MPLGNYFAGLPMPFIDIAVYVVGFMGALALAYAVLLEAEKKQDAVFVVASASLFVYGLLRGDKIIMLAMGLMFLVAGREMIQILRGKHKHSTDMVKEYKKE
jgi:hypothetical protein